MSSTFAGAVTSNAIDAADPRAMPESSGARLWLLGAALLFAIGVATRVLPLFEPEGRNCASSRPKTAT